jgi:hypothetical protein
MRIVLISLVILSTACTELIASRPYIPKAQPTITSLKAAESQANPKGKQILQIGRKMALDEKVIIVGGCWDYVDAVFTRAGFPRGQRDVVFKGTLRNGPYANLDALRPGDWIYHINHSYHGIEHSGIFVKWIDKKNAIGLMLSYRGEKSRTPARYKNYDLSNVYRITRAK